MLFSSSYSKKCFENKHFVVVAQSKNYTASIHVSENKLRTDLGTKLKHSYAYSCDLPLVAKLRTGWCVAFRRQRDCLLPFIHGDFNVILSLNTVFMG